MEWLEEPAEVYNFEVADYHTYYVGDGDVLVHNKCANPSGKDGGIRSNEVVLPKERTHDAARNTLLKELDKTGAFVNGSNRYVGRLEKSYGYKKQIGRESFDKKIRWRLDFDEIIGVHYNIDDFSAGRGTNAVKTVILIDISYDEYKKIIDLWN